MTLVENTVLGSHRGVWREGGLSSLTHSPEPSSPRPMGGQRLSGILTEVEQLVLEPRNEVHHNSQSSGKHIPCYYHIPILQRRRLKSRGGVAFAQGDPQVITAEQGFKSTPARWHSPHPTLCPQKGF